MPAVLTGLTTAEASRRLAIDGPNRLPQARPPSALRLLGRQFTHLLAVLLWVASALALVAGQPPLAAAIVVVILLNALFAFAQEYRADRSAEELRSMLPVSARVRRDGQLRVIDATKLVRGRPGHPPSRRPDQRRPGADRLALPRGGRVDGHRGERSGAARGG